MITNRLLIIPIIIISLSIGILFSLYQRNLLIITYINPWKEYTQQKNSKNTQLTIPLIYWSGHHWNIEEQNIIKNNNAEEFLLHLIQSWIVIMHTEKKILRQPQIQAVMIGTMGNDLYISFSHNWLPSNCSITEKYLYILGLLYTVHNNDPKIKTVQLLVDHQHMPDEHLNFSYSWPIKAVCNDTPTWFPPLPKIIV